MAAPSEQETVYAVCRADWKITGFFDHQEVEEMFAQGLLIYSDYLWRSGMSEWQTVQEVFPQHAPKPPAQPLTEEFLDQTRSFGRDRYGRPSPQILMRNRQLDYDTAVAAIRELDEAEQPLLKTAVRLIFRDKELSPSRLQRETDSGYLKSMGALETLQTRGLLYRAEGAKPWPAREVWEDETVEDLIREYVTGSQWQDGGRRPEELPDAKMLDDALGERRCIANDGRILYRVNKRGLVLDGDNRPIGTVRPNGDIYRPDGQRIARNGDAGLLLSLGALPP